MDFLVLRKRNTMKIAILFSGQLRGFPLCKKSLNDYILSVFSKDDVDIFFYIPDEDRQYINEVLDFDIKSLLVEKDFYHNIENRINCNNNITYSNTKISSNNYKLKGRIQHYLLQWYGVKKVFEMMESYGAANNITYDLIFRIRCDCSPRHIFPIDEIKKDEINVPNFDHYGGIHDRFAVGNFDNMKIYCSKYNYFDLDTMGNGNSESKMCNHLNNFNIKVNKINFMYDRLTKDGSIQP